MTVYEGVSLSASNTTPKASTNSTFTVAGFTNGTHVYATIALSAVSQGVSNATGTVGAAGCIIRSWQTFNPNGSVNTFNNVALSGNNMSIVNCASVTFELTVEYATATAMAVVYTV